MSNKCTGTRILTWAVLNLKRGKTLDIVNFQAYFTLQTINLEIDIFEMFWSFPTDPIS